MLIVELRACGSFAPLAARCQEEAHRVYDRGSGDPQLEDARLTESDLLTWFVRLRPDIAALSSRLGFSDEGSCRRSLLREYCYTNDNI